MPSYAKQFKRGTMPQEPISPGGPIYREAEAPSKIRKRQGLALGTQAQARPGMVGKQDFKRRGGRGK